MRIVNSKTSSSVALIKFLLYTKFMQSTLKDLSDCFIREYSGCAKHIKSNFSDSSVNVSISHVYPKKDGHAEDSCLSYNLL